MDFEEGNLEDPVLDNFYHNSASSSNVFNDDAIFADYINLDDDFLFQDSWNTVPAVVAEPFAPASTDTFGSDLTRQAQQKPVIALPSASSLAVQTALTSEQAEYLRGIAMPDYMQRLNLPSPDSTNSRKSSSASSPDSFKNRKRKLSPTSGEDDGEDDDRDPPVKKTAHNMIEKRYRNNLNDKIAELRDSVPSLRVYSKSMKGEDTAADREHLQSTGLTAASKLNKGTVLAKATEYIHHLEDQNKRLATDNEGMKARLAAFEKLYMSGVLGPQPSLTQTKSPQNSPLSEPIPEDNLLTHDLAIKGMIPVPENIRNMNSTSGTSQQTYAVPQQRLQSRNSGHAANGWVNSGFVGKLVVGSLATLMLVEGLAESEQGGQDSGARGLFAIPSHFFGAFNGPWPSSPTWSPFDHGSSSRHMITLLKLALAFAAIFYVLLLPTWKSRSSKVVERQRFAQASAPSLASSIQVRRKAWLTAVQSVWIPRRNILLEIAALLLNTLKLTLRNVMGWYYYSVLTGTTHEHEAARIKNWSIALDAQLAGGDVDINKSRLMLTLIASGTLPDTPARLMLKSIHVRVLLWEFGNAGFDGYYLFHAFAARIGCWKWNEAKKVQQRLLLNPSESAHEVFEPLPSHLVALLEQEFDNVLVDNIGSRAHNLAWNLPTNYNALGSSDGMDGVVTDFAVRSALDAVAAWFSSLVLQRVLSGSLEEGGNVETISADLDLAIRTAPIGSGSHIRALIARAVLLDETRGAHIAAALQMYESKKDQGQGSISAFSDSTTCLSAWPDLGLSMKCATAIAHLKRGPAGWDAAGDIIHTLRASDMSLLGFGAAYKLMVTIADSRDATRLYAPPLELLAGTLRIWAGGKDGAARGLGKAVRAHVVAVCLSITRRMVCVDPDSGYDSTSEHEPVPKKETVDVGQAGTLAE